MPAIWVGLHVFEEVVWPGGFLAWYRAYRPEFAASLTVRFVVVVSELLIVFALMLAAFGPTSSRGVSASLALIAALACNGVFHVRGTIRSKHYSPGMATVLLLYIPLCAWGYWFFMEGGFSLQAALFSFAVGAAYQFWSVSNHRKRSAHAYPISARSDVSICHASCWFRTRAVRRREPLGR
jgi:hypothetical protein